MRRSSMPLKTLSTLVMSMGALSAHAAGFQLFEQNNSGLGNAYAGSAAIAENASTIYFNPAGMSLLDGVNVSGGVSLIKPSFKFSDSGLSRNPTALGGGRPTGGSGGDPGTLGVVPNGYVSWQLDDRWHVGLGLGAPFGSMTKYDAGWAGQYQSRKFDVKTYNVNPSVSYRVTETFSLGAGVNWQRLEAEYERQAILPPGLLTPADVNMSGDAWGWNAGAMWQATDKTRIGLSYRSKVRHKVDGNTEVGPLKVDAKTSVDFPDTAILSLVQNLNSRWDLLADVSWTGWSSIPELRIRNSGGLPDDALKLEFNDAWRIAVGANYKINDAWKWKVGVAWDQTPVSSPRYRPVSLPDNDRWWFATGVQWQATKSTTIDLGYSYLYLDKTKINNDGENQVQKGLVNGQYKSHGNVVGLQVSSRF